ncbi:CocE/NonD family hydrolase [Novosphingobium sp. FKTRR1]|uniref:CocE/NonD family hydrolase n=1 Tax=Novosphingobium sp. FKTRR1 TaxID=2879118 RepID=UPI001CF07975|nr:CocE/NonD family hydrolase [Novosphingobium sp. FKTRR1]
MQDRHRHAQRAKRKRWCASLFGSALALVAVAPGGFAQGVAPGNAPAPGDANASHPMAQVQHQPFWAKRLTGYLAARDGTQLRYSVLLPKGKGPFPVIVNYSGYDPGSIGGAAYLDDNTAMAVNLDRTLVEAGYAVAGVNARGTACSEGQFEFLARSYGQDGRDAIEFFAAQGWSNGSVGMANWSWAGMSQIATAAERPPHLKAIAPGMVLGDARLDSWAIGGVPAPNFVAGWWDFLHGRWDSALQSARAEGDNRCVAQIATNLKTAETARVADILTKHPLRDDYIEIRHLGARTGRIEVPILSMEAFQDEATTPREDYYQDNLNLEKLWFVQTNGPHDMYESLVFRKTLLGFFDRFVKGQDNGFDKGPHVQVWLETSTATGGRLANENSQPRLVVNAPRYPAAVKPVSFELSSGGKLVQGGSDGKNDGRGEGRGEGRGDDFAYPLPGPTVNADFLSDTWGPLPTDWRKGSLAYTSAAMDDTLFAYGSASADLWVAATGSDADLQVTLTEVRPDGQEMFVQRGFLRLSDRVQDDSRSNPLRPYPLDRPETMASLTPGEPVLGRVELTKFAHLFRKGSRLRLWIDTPSQYGGNGFAPYSQPQTITVLHDAQHPSRLLVGQWDQASGVTPKLPEERPACGTILKQPCRPDPLASR